MADNIHYLNYDDTVVPALSSGTSGFPFQVQVDGTVDDPEYFPLALPLEVANSSVMSCAQLWGRVREVTLTANISVTAGGVTRTLTSGAMTDVRGYTREQHLFDKTPGNSYRHWEKSSTGALTTFVPFLRINAGDPELWLDGADFKPNLNLNGSIGASDNGGADEITLSWSSRPSDPVFVGTPSVLTIDFFGYSLDLYYEVVATGSTSFTFSQHDLSATGWWPYDFSGSPIYDATTGLELQDPKL